MGGPCSAPRDRAEHRPTTDEIYKACLDAAVLISRSLGFENLACLRRVVSFSDIRPATSDPMTSYELTGYVAAWFGLRWEHVQDSLTCRKASPDPSASFGCRIRAARQTHAGICRPAFLLGEEASVIDEPCPGRSSTDHACTPGLPACCSAAQRCTARRCNRNRFLPHFC
jgi:hypothetical protein